jgi:DNA (cytosine-5)-methyltransferase 1
MSNELTAVDMFAGAGGLSLGLQMAGFRPVFAFDSDPYACETYRRNLGPHIRQARAEAITAAAILKATGLRKGQLSLVCGGPPCQGFSVQGLGRPGDSRNDLVLEFARIAAALAPSAILMENVPTILGRRGSWHLEALTRLLRSEGYAFVTKVLNASDFGVPQDRNRAFLVAWRESGGLSFAFPQPLRAERRTVRQALRGLPEPPEDFSEHPDFANHVRVRITKINQERIRHVPEGGGRLDIPKRLQLPCHRKAGTHRHLDVFGRMSWGRPAPTITALFDSFTRGRFGHPEENRAITAREGARLQSFPDTFRFCGPKKDVARQIGNAVPPMLAAAVASAIRQFLEASARRLG